VVEVVWSEQDPIIDPTAVWMLLEGHGAMSSPYHETCTTRSAPGRGFAQRQCVISVQRTSWSLVDPPGQTNHHGAVKLKCADRGGGGRGYAPHSVGGYPPHTRLNVRINLVGGVFARVLGKVFNFAQNHPNPQRSVRASGGGRGVELASFKLPWNPDANDAPKPSPSPSPSLGEARRCFSQLWNASYGFGAQSVVGRATQPPPRPRPTEQAYSQRRRSASGRISSMRRGTRHCCAPSRIGRSGLARWVRTVVLRRRILEAWSAWARRRAVQVWNPLRWSVEAWWWVGKGA